MKKAFILAQVLVILAQGAIAQQVPKVTHFWYDQTRINPGSAGNTDMICASLIYRDMMMGFTEEGTPRIFMGNINVPFKLFGANHGAGLAITSDQIGFYRDVDARISYAYQAKVGDGNLGIGAAFGFIQKGLEGAEWKAPMGETPDGNIPTDGDQGNGFTVSPGVFYRTEDIYFGVSAMNLYSNGVSYKTTSVEEKIVPHYFLTAGYDISLPNPSFSLAPAVLMQTDLKAVNFDINATLTYNKKIWGGVTYRPGVSINPLIGFELMNGARIGVSYEYMTTDMQKHINVGGLEFVLNYCFKLGVEKMPQKYRSIRYL